MVDSAPLAKLLRELFSQEELESFATGFPAGRSILNTLPRPVALLGMSEHVARELLRYTTTEDIQKALCSARPAQVASIEAVFKG